ncbi:MAG: DegT/DnrJ/EryC1/StrS family aminotransferase [Firmicutes bacterium]|nr:DegT/DnrJ/EryC1/StrS family aminotransferase [Alicyclobacillaceae bacterium]MCL6496267.1 DegT/DnrJ/EryC1/StrS family aminotransferase [Bacillota bacterium]
MRIPAFDLTRQLGELGDAIRAAMASVMETGQFILGPAVAAFETEVAAWLGVEHAIGVANGSDALYLALKALGVGPGDEVIVPAFTFFATAGSVVRCGARPVFTDIDLDTFNMEPEEALSRVTPRTRAILPVHLFGWPCDLDRLREGFSGPVVEDAAQAFGAEWAGRRVGGWGTVGCFSFFPTKNLGALGDGGLVTTRDADLAARVRRLRVHGATQKYVHAEVGINSRLDALQAAVLSVKLPRVAAWNQRRAAIAARYAAGFSAFGLGEVVAWPRVPAEVGHVFHQYTVRVADRDRLRQHLAQHGVETAVYYPLPLHLQPALAEYGEGPGSLPRAEAACQTVLSLPMFPELTDAEVDRVVELVAAFYGKA